jgi:hypothetical protein
MKKAILAGAAVLIFSSGAALAQAVYVTPGYVEPAYIAPAPVYVAPAPVYVAPATTVIVHRPIVRPAPVVTAAAPVYDYAPGEGYYTHAGDTLIGETNHSLRALMAQQE